MKKQLLLSLAAVTLAEMASAESYKAGEAFAYQIDPTFAFEFIDAQYPADEMRGQASMEYGFGLASAWFAQMLPENKNNVGINEMCPVVEDPYNPSTYAIRMQTSRWDAYGNFNFALPEVGEPCRVRVVYRAATEGIENAWYDGTQKPFHVKLMDDNDQDTPDYPEITEQNLDFWTNPGWRVAEFVTNLDADKYYLSILWNAGGLSCGRNVPFYVKEVSVVPTRLISGYTAPADNQKLTISTTMPDLVTVGGTPAPAGQYALGEAFCYDIDNSFQFAWIDNQYPVEELRGQASLEYGFGMAAAWFSQMRGEYKSEEGINQMCPVVEDPWNPGEYVIRMQTDYWDAYGNFNFALPEMNQPSRVRVIYRVNPAGVENVWYNNGDKKPFHIKLMNNADQDSAEELNEYNETFWDNPGWRVAEYVTSLEGDNYYLSLLWDAGGLSCQRNVPFYVKEVSVVPLNKLEDYTIPADNKSLSVVAELPTTVKVDRGAAVNAVKGANASIAGGLGAIRVTDYNGVVEVYNLFGQKVAKAAINGEGTVAVPAGINIVKAGKTAAKVVVR